MVTWTVALSSLRTLRYESEGATALSDKMPRLVLEARRVSSLLAHGLHGRRRAGPGESFWQFRPFVTGEAAARARFYALPIAGCPLVVEFPLCRSAGRALLSRVFATPGLQIADGTHA